MIHFFKKLALLGKHMAFYHFCILWTMFLTLLSFPLLCGPKKSVFWLSRLWVTGLLWAVKHCLDITYRIHGQHYLPDEGPYIIACKHQSVWETLIFSTLVENPAFFLKQSLLHVPCAGWFLRKLCMIPVRRSQKRDSFIDLTYRYAIISKRPIIIFPEGTRMAIGKKKRYRKGVFILSHQFDLKVIPAALNSGAFWRKHTFFKKPGVIDLVFLPPLPLHLTDTVFMATLEQAIEQTCAEISPLTTHHMPCKSAFG